MSKKYLSIFIFCEHLLTFSLDSSPCASADAELGSLQDYLEEAEMSSLQGSLRDGRALPCHAG